MIEHRSIFWRAQQGKFLHYLTCLIVFARYKKLHVISPIAFCQDQPVSFIKNQFHGSYVINTYFKRKKPSETILYYSISFIPILNISL